MDPSDNPQAAPSADIPIGGHVSALFAFDIGFQIDLDRAGELAQGTTRQRVVRARRPAPVWFDYKPPPLRLVVAGPTEPITGLRTSGDVELLIYDFGAALLTYRFPMPDRLGGLPALSAALFENEALAADASSRLERIMRLITPAIERPKLREFIEDYAVFSVTSWPAETAPAVLAGRARGLIARAIEAETGELSAEQVDRSAGGWLSYTPRDLAIVGWNAAVLFDEAPDDVLAVLQHANLELLELRVLDQELDEILDHADETLSNLVRRRLWPAFEERRMLRRFASVQTDTAVMFEGVNNAIKLLGNQYLARLYRLAAERLDLPAWQRSVQRKLSATESLYQKMSDASSIRRLETLEVIIIVLIALSIVLAFIPGAYGSH